MADYLSLFTRGESTWMETCTNGWLWKIWILLHICFSPSPMRAHSALTSAIRRIRRRHRPRTYGCQSIWLYSLCRPESRIHWTAKNSTDQNSFYWPKSTDQEAACVEQKLFFTDILTYIAYAYHMRWWPATSHMSWYTTSQVMVYDDTGVT